MTKKTVAKKQSRSTSPAPAPIGDTQYFRALMAAVTEHVIAPGPGPFVDVDPNVIGALELQRLIDQAAALYAAIREAR